MQGVETSIAKMIDEALENQRIEIEARVREITERILAARLAKLATSAELPEGEWLDREQVMEQYGVPYYKIRDLEITGKIPTLRQGRKVLARREDVDEVLRKAA